MKSKTLLLLSFFPLFLLQACGGGKIVMKSTNGSDISIKKENVFCETDTNEPPNWIKCTANGIQTDLTNRQYPFSEQKDCYWRASGRRWKNEDSFACSAAKKFGMLEISE